MEYSTPDSVIQQQMESANPILGNPLLLAAILLFLAILPRALRYILAQKEKTALDRMVERFEKEELKNAGQAEFDEISPEHEKHVSPKDPSLAYLMEDASTAPETQGNEGIPPFPEQEEEKPVKIVKEGVPISHNEDPDLIPAPKEKAKLIEQEELVKIVKEGVPISHNEDPDLFPAPKKKAKLIKQEISIAPGEIKASSKKAPSEPLRGEKNKTPAKDQKSTREKDFKAPSDSVEKESGGNWVEAEIPGLIMDPPPAAKSEGVPTFKASPKERPQAEAKKPLKSSSKEKQGLKVKSIAPKSEKIKDSKLEKKESVKPDSLELEMEISESKPKAVEIKAPVVSHKNIAKKKARKKKAKVLSSKAGRTQKIEAEVKAAPPQREEIKASSEEVKPKPFLLDLKYLDAEEMNTVDPAPSEKLPADMMDVVIARLNALQVNLENQLVGQLVTEESPINGNTPKNKIQESFPDAEEAINTSLDTKDVSLEELDSFLFTATQRKI